MIWTYFLIKVSINPVVERQCMTDIFIPCFSICSRNSLATTIKNLKNACVCWLGNPSSWALPWELKNKCKKHQKSVLQKNISHSLFFPFFGNLLDSSPAAQEIWVWSLGWEDPLKEGMATQLQYSYLGNAHEQRSLAGYNPWGRIESDMTERLCTAGDYTRWLA